MRRNILINLFIIVIIFFNVKITFSEYHRPGVVFWEETPPSGEKEPGGGGLRCHSGGCKALECEIEINNTGGINFGGGGGNIGFSGKARCKTFIKSGAYCCCWLESNPTRLFGKTIMSASCGC